MEESKSCANALRGVLWGGSVGGCARARGHVRGERGRGERGRGAWGFDGGDDEQGSSECKNIA